MRVLGWFLVIVRSLLYACIQLSLIAAAGMVFASTVRPDLDPYTGLFWRENMAWGYLITVALLALTIVLHYLVYEGEPFNPA